MLAAAQVVQAIADLLVAGATPAGARVYTSRAWPIDVLPAWRVTAEDEEVQQISIGEPPVNDHRLTVRMQGLCHADADLDDALHAMAAAACEAVFAESSVCAGKAGIGLARLERRMQEDQQASVGEIAVDVSANFQTLANAPETLL